MATQVRGTCWSVTINNPKACDDEQIAFARQKSGWKVYGQREKGAQGTEHYQLMVTTPQVRFSAVKKSFPRAHIELARDRTALARYVEKEETKIGDLPQSQDSYPSHTRLMAWYGVFFDEYGEEHGGVEEHEYLKIFKIMIRAKIREGFFVETLAVNPQILSLIKLYGRDIAFRERVRRQTDRQTPEINVEVKDITNASEEGSEESNEETDDKASSQGTTDEGEGESSE